MSRTQIRGSSRSLSVLAETWGWLSEGCKEKLLKSEREAQQGLEMNNQG